MYISFLSSFCNSSQQHDQGRTRRDALQALLHAREQSAAPLPPRTALSPEVGQQPWLDGSPASLKENLPQHRPSRSSAPYGARTLAKSSGAGPEECGAVAGTSTTLPSLIVLPSLPPSHLPPPPSPVPRSSPCVPCANTTLVLTPKGICAPHPQHSHPPAVADATLLFLPALQG